MKPISTLYILIVLFSGISIQNQVGVIAPEKYTGTNKIENKYKVGDFTLGGIVFWVDETMEHGLACAIEDQDRGSGIQWYNGSYTNTEAFGDSVYAGEMNTLLIIANQGSSSDDYAAGVCAAYSVTQDGTTYEDWYLPSKYELSLMYENRKTINANATTNGGNTFANTWYWSSTEANKYYAWSHNFNGGHQDDASKNAHPTRVRAIRAF